ncbi:MAG TPA: LysE family transporter [Stellaceae bacterium]|nr:LysE family transporter [Stellaceae bacterium]
MEALVPFLSILGALALGAISPGPSFVFVVRTSLALSRRDGIAAALGMGVGGVIFAVLALLGLQALLAKTAWLYAALRLAGALYLLYLAFRLWRSAAEPIVVPGSADRRAPGPVRSFGLGLATQSSNPKTAIVYGSIFAALLPPAPPAWLFVALPPAVMLIETGWYTIVAASFSSEPPRAAYLRGKRWIDRAAGALMGALGLRLAIETARLG